MWHRLAGTTCRPGSARVFWAKKVRNQKKRVPLTITLLSSSSLKKYGPMITLDHKPHQTVHFSGFMGSYCIARACSLNEIRQFYLIQPEMSFVAEDNFYSEMTFIIILHLFR